MAFHMSNLLNRAQTKADVILPDPVILAVFLVVHDKSLNYSKSEGTLELQSCMSWGSLSVLSGVGGCL